MNKNKQFGYFHVTIRNELSRTLFSSNNERAFVMSFLQNTLSTRTMLESPLGYHSLSAHIDLLAFSLIRSSCEFVLFSISRQSVDILCRRLRQELSDYSESYGHSHKGQLSIAIKQLSGPHSALHQTTLLHNQHDDWEYDRYSSIGFYLHDRRGDWMRLWRMAQLYNYDSTKYRALSKITRIRQPGAEIASSAYGLHSIKA